MPYAQIGDCRLHYLENGPQDAPALVFANEIGTDLRIWDRVLRLLPKGLRLLRFDLRGQGASDVSESPYRMGQMISDCESLLDQLAIRDAVCVGVGLGGLIAQGLATKRLDQIRALVLTGTGARIGFASHWDGRGLLALAEGMESAAPDLLERWSQPKFRDPGDFLEWRRMFLAQSPEGFAGACAAISGSDFYTTTAALTLPALIIAGREDGFTPPDLLRELANLMSGADFHLLRGAGHLAMLDRPEDFAAALTSFLARLGLVPEFTG